MVDDRNWMYKRILRNKTINPEFVDGVREFLNKAFNTRECVTTRHGEDLIVCPYEDCKNRVLLNRETVRRHLLNKGFRLLYHRWYEHGEPRAMSEPEKEEDMMETMVMDAAGFNFYQDASEDPPNEKAKAIFDMLAAANKPLWEIDLNGERTIRCENQTILSYVTQYLNLKSDFQMTEDCFNRMLSINKSGLPRKEELPRNYYEAKKLVRGLGLEYKKIHACRNDCMLYYKPEDKRKDRCDICKEPRYKIDPNRKKGKPVPQKVLRYLPITPRLQRLYISPSTSQHMTWHRNGIRENRGLMVHPADGEAWQKFDEAHPDFAADIRNVRLGLATDGFTLYNMNAPPYTCWPVFLFPYNLPPNLIMKNGSLFLTLIIPGPHSPGKDIDVYLQPLIDELKDLWLKGIETYDSFRKQNFVMRASLLWTISDFPGFEMLSGWGTHGLLACPICMERTKSFTLKKGGKPCWFDCHRMFLPSNHKFRRQSDKFMKNRWENDSAPHRRSGEEMQDIVMGLPENKFGKRFGLERFRGYGTDHHWQKRSIFWELPYWSSNLVRHTLDGMHIEKNNTDNIFNTCMDTSKTKDNLKARHDMAELCNRAELELEERPGRKFKKPIAKYVLSREDKRKVCQWLKDIRFPDGYASNWSRCVNMKTCKFSGLKSHDMHVFMERLMPVAFRDFLPDDIWEALTELSNFFSDLCAKEVDPKHLEKLEKGVVVTICKLEKFFPPGFFDSMEHLVIHLAYETRVCGPIQFHWMYPIEREMKKLRKKVGNKAHPEGSIAESYIIEEVSKFCSGYFDDNVRTRLYQTHRHYDGGEPQQDDRPSIFTFPGRTIGKARRTTLSHTEYFAAHLYILLNCPEVQSYVNIFDGIAHSLHQDISDEELQSLCEDKFAAWFRKKVQTSHDIDSHIKYIGLGPLDEVHSFNAYDVNGYRFHTETYGQNKSTVNSGLCIKGGWYDGVEHDYYGIIEKILELQYRGADNKVVLFKCRWFDMKRGIHIDKKHGLVEVKPTSLLQTYEPFVYACQAIQVYYLPYPSKKKDRRDWWVATKIKAKCVSPLYGDDSNHPEFFQEEGLGVPFAVSTGDGLDAPNSLHEPGMYELVDGEALLGGSTQAQEEHGDNESETELSSEDEQEELSDEEDMDESSGNDTAEDDREDY